MPVIYNSKKLIPVPTVVINKEYVRNSAGKLRRVLWKIQVNGFLSVHKGSPDYNGDFWTGAGYPPDTPGNDITDDNRLEILRNKKAAISNLFSDKGKLFEIQSYNGAAPIKFIPRITSLDFQEGNWYEFIRYSINMETDHIFFGDVEQTENESGSDDTQESWQIEQSDERGKTYKITHNISSQQNDKYDLAGTGTIEQYGWEIAKEYVDNLLGINQDIIDNSVTGAGDTFTPYNHVIQESIDEGEGRYSVSESWLLVEGGPYIEDYTVSKRTSVSDGLTTVSIEGNVQGLSTGLGFSDKWTNAQNAWATISGYLYSRAQTISGVTLNASPFNYTTGANPNSAVITYNYEYNNRFGSILTGSLGENITINDSLPADIFAVHRVVLRPSGPIIQGIGTVTEKKRTLTLTANMPPATNASLATPPDATEVTNIISTYTPTGAIQGPYLERNEASFDYHSGRYSRSVSWTWV